MPSSELSQKKEGTGTRNEERSPALLFPLSSSLILCLGAAACAAEPPADRPQSAVRWRRPAAAVLLDEGRLLCVANRHSGSITLIDTAAMAVVDEVEFGGTLSDLAALPDERHLLATDEAGHELLVIAREGAALRPAARLPVAPWPVSVRVLAAGRLCSVASLWSRRVEIFDLASPSRDRSPPARTAAESACGLAPSRRHSLPLPFAPREQLPLRGAKLAIADSFGGRLAVVDAERGVVESAREIVAHNIRGLALAPDRRRLMISHQTLNPLARTERDDVHWGVLMGSHVRSLDLDRLLDPAANLADGGRLVPLHKTEHGAADPAGLAVADDGAMLVALSGSGQALFVSPSGELRRCAVGRRPTAVVTDPRAARAYVLNTHSDSVSVLDLRRREVVGEVSLGPAPAPGPAERGELLFHDARLSHDGWMSCHSCHTDGHSNGLLADTLGDGTFGTPKRVLSLLGTGLTDPWGWTGRVWQLNEQVEQSVETTMHGRPLAPREVMDLVTFMQRLPAAPAVAPRPVSPQDSARLERGRRVFEARRCGRCHIPSLTYTSHGSHAVGLADEAGHTKFNPPSLRGVSQRDACFHDNRAASLEEVFTDHGHQLDEPLSDEDLTGLVRFLRSL